MGGSLWSCGWLPGWQLRAGPNQEERSSPPSSRCPSALLPPSFFSLFSSSSGSYPLPLYLPYLWGTFCISLTHGVSRPLPPQADGQFREDKLVKGRVVPGEGPAPVGWGRLGPRRKGTAGEGGRAGGIFNQGQQLELQGRAAPPDTAALEGIPGRWAAAATPPAAPSLSPAPWAPPLGPSSTWPRPSLPPTPTSSGSPARS